MRRYFVTLAAATTMRPLLLLWCEPALAPTNIDPSQQDNPEAKD